jgi:hypothetical protein
MTDHDLLEDPNGAPYPETVQRLARAIDLAELGPYVLESGREALVQALEAAIAADREHRPPAPELDQQQHDRLVNIYAAGMGAGAATALMNLHVQPEQAQHIGLHHIAFRMLEDPATRLELETITTRMWTGDYDQPVAWQNFTAYPSPRTHRDD